MTQHDTVIYQTTKGGSHVTQSVPHVIPSAARNLKPARTLIALVITAIVFFASLASLAGVAYASWVVVDDTQTQVTTVSLDVELITDTSSTSAQYPGADITRDIAVKNTGNADIFVRINIGGSFEDENGTILEDTNNYIEVAYDPTYWKDGGDGYYYLKGTLAPGITSGSCIDTITLSTAIPGEYGGYIAHVNPKVEALQTTSSAITSVWGKDYAFMEASEPAPRGEGYADITFIDPDTGFIFSPDTKDIYPNAKNLTPGESVTNSVTFANTYKDKISVEVSSGLFTRTSDTDSFSQYATLTITDEDGSIIFSGPAAGEEWDAFTHTLILSPGAARTWKATLAVQAGAPNALQGINTTLLSWELVAQDATDPPGPTPDPKPDPQPNPHPSSSTPHTGDSLLMIALALVTLGSGILLIIIARKRKKDKKGDTHE